MIILPEKARASMQKKMAHRPWRVIQSRDEMPVSKWEGEYIILPVAEADGLIGCFDLSYGFNLLWDGEEWHISKNGIFLKDYCFLGGHFGYTDGAIFKRI